MALCVAMQVGLCFSCKPPRIDRYRPSASSPESASGASQAADGESTVLAAVDDSEITLAEFQRRLSRLSPLAQRRVGTETTRRQMLEAMIDMRLLAAEAEAAGYASDPIVVQSERAALREVVLDRLVRPALPQPSDVTDAEVRQAYEAELFRYQRPELARVGVIVVPSRAEAVSIVTAYRRRTDLDVRTSMELFDSLAREHSIAPPQAVDLGFVSRETLSEVASPVVVEAAFGLVNAGQSADPVPVAGGQAVLYLIERRDALDEPLDAVAESIREQIVERRRQDAVEATLARLRQDADLTIDESFMRQLDSAAAQPPTVTRRPWEALTNAELDRELTPRHDLGFLGDLLRSPPEPPEPPEVTDGDDGE